MMNHQFDFDLYQAPQGAKQILLHSCCAPCSCAIIDRMLQSDLNPTVFYYNPNIHPLEEYETRKEENKRYCDKKGVPFVDADYDVDHWYMRVRGLENEPERGKRCSVCFMMRMECTAAYAARNNFSVFATSLGISRLKNQDQVYAAGHQAAVAHENLVFWDYNWRKQAGNESGALIARQEAFYRQTYCGCIFSRQQTE
jgi:predicted adenine nucleotide alpha hydrolase (AANH) superfamily ATPase